MLRGQKERERKEGKEERREREKKDGRKFFSMIRTSI